MHYFKNFKGFAEAELDLLQNFTLLIGPNGSGKSNLIEAIELLSFLAHGGPLHEITDLNKDSKAEIRGGLQSCARYGENTFTLGFSETIHREPSPLRYRLTIETAPTPIIVDESLFIGNQMIFEVIKTKSNQHSLRVRYNNFATGGKKPQTSVSPMQTLLSQYQSFATRNQKRWDYYGTIINATANNLHASFIFDPQPKLMRNYERIGNRILTKNGSNLSAVLYALSQGNEEERHSLHRLLNWIKQLPNEPYEDFDFVTVPRLHDVTFGLIETYTHQLISASVLSDGTLRCLAVLTALETVEPNSRVIIEEFDNGLHPSRVGILIKAIEDCCQRRKLTVLVTTHNPATLNTLTPSQLNSVVLCHTSPPDHRSKLVRLRDLPYQEEMLERGQLGDLVTRQVIDQYLAPNLPQQRQQKALEWLKEL